MTAQACPEWAKRVVTALADASWRGHNELTENEYNLITAASLMIRLRFGDTVLDEETAHEGIAGILRTILRDLDGQEGER